LLADHEKICVDWGWLESPVLDLSRYAFEALQKDEDFILFSGRSKDDPSQVLVISPLAEYPAPEILKWLEHAYSLRDELDVTRAANGSNQGRTH
jgi:hypothetical protein